jgi:hypothetical protein
MAFWLGLTTFTITSAITPHTTRNSRNMMHLQAEQTPTVIKVVLNPSKVC